MNAQPMTALIVEDDEATAELETRAISRMGMQVCCAGTNADAIHALNREPIAVVLLDHRLPDGPSWPVLEAALNANTPIPVIIVTAAGDERVAAEAIHRGASDYVVKCVTFWDQLPLLIERVIKLSEAERAQAHLAAIVECSPDAIVSITPDGTIQSWNAAATLMYGYPPEEAIGANISILAAAGISNDFPGILERLNRGEMAGCLESVQVGKDGEETALSLTISPIRDAREKVIGLSIIAHDFTERKARHVAEEASKAKSAFLANMSHEIRTPMNAIVGFNYLMQQTSMTLRQSEYAAKIGVASKSLLGLINDILDLSKVEAGKIELERIEFNLEDVLSKLVQMTSVLVQQKRLAFKIEIASDAPPRLIGDPMRLEQVLLNLSSNAIKFTESGEVVTFVELLERTDAGVILRFKVRDRGIGMRPSQIRRLFRPFEQADSTTTRRHGGTGLGLAISKQLVKLMDGEFEVESDPGEGSEFRFTARFGEPAGNGTPKSSARTPGIKQRALVIDRVSASRMMLTRILGDLKFSVTACATCEECVLEIYREGDTGSNDFDVVLIDGSVPGEDWAAGVRHIREALGGKTMPKTILIADQRAADQKLDCKDMGIDDIVFKPLTRSTVYDAIMRVQARRGAPIQPSSANGHSSVLQGSRILLVEDEEINQQVAIEILSIVGCEVTAASNGAEALSKLFSMSADRKFDAVLLDLHMPDMDGLAVARHVRAEKRFAMLPIIAMTADAIQGVQQSCMAAGMDGYLTKPIDPDEMFATLRRWIPAGKSMAVR